MPFSLDRHVLTIDSSDNGKVYALGDGVVVNMDIGQLPTFMIRFHKAEGAYSRINSVFGICGWLPDGNVAEQIILDTVNQAVELMFDVVNNRWQITMLRGLGKP